MFYRESLEINTPELVLAEYDNITIYKKLTTVKFDSVSVDFLSWICDENKEATFEFIKNSKSDYCFAHKSNLKNRQLCYQILLLLGFCV